MCGTCENGTCKNCGHKGAWGGCTMSMITKVLVVVGGLNWGLVGAGMIAGSMNSWNLVSMLVGSWPMLEAVVYLLVGISAVAQIFGCRCKKCMDGVCNDCATKTKV
ncbi:MAG: DUF378 domain-containing protein [Candidatus Nomurabacteria bacterium]|nr:DUF378 domain-containing protein [Candidatus Nomurabacteria bacterium]